MTVNELIKELQSLKHKDKVIKIVYNPERGFNLGFNGVHECFDSGDPYLILEDSVFK